MEIRIRHVTAYHYKRPVMLRPHRLMLVPRGGPELQVLAISVRCEPEADLDWTQDAFGNVVVTASFAKPTSKLLISTDIAVRNTAAEWPIFRIAPAAHAYPFDYSEDERTDLAAFMRPEHPDAEGELASWAHTFLHARSTDTLSLLKAMSAGMLDHVTYGVRDQEGTQAPFQTLSIGSGSCRDIAALYIEAVRHLGFAARAVSGYLLDPETSNGDAGSTHAWTEVYLPGAGWVAFDPTHGRVGTANLVPVAVGRRNEHIMPISGGYVGDTADFLAMDVRVTAEPVEPVRMPAWN